MHHTHAAAEIAFHTSQALRWIPLLPLAGTLVNFLVGVHKGNLLFQSEYY